MMACCDQYVVDNGIMFEDVENKICITTKIFLQ